jgi:hypothetical protein
LISGTALTPQMATFSVVVTDSAGCSGTNSYTLVIRPSPQLSISYDGASVVLCWSTNYADFRLTAASEIPSANWPTVSPAPSVVGDRYCVTNNSTDPKRFYRLSNP